MTTMSTATFTLQTLQARNTSYPNHPPLAYTQQFPIPTFLLHFTYTAPYGSRLTYGVTNFRQPALPLAHPLSLPSYGYTWLAASQ